MRKILAVLLVLAMFIPSCTNLIEDVNANTSGVLSIDSTSSEQEESAELSAAESEEESKNEESEEQSDEFEESDESTEESDEPSFEISDEPSVEISEEYSVEVSEEPSVEISEEPFEEESKQEQADDRLTAEKLYKSAMEYANKAESFSAHSVSEIGLYTSKPTPEMSFYISSDISAQDIGKSSAVVYVLISFEVDGIKESTEYYYADGIGYQYIKSGVSSLKVKEKIALSRFLEICGFGTNSEKNELNCNDFKNVTMVKEGGVTEIALSELKDESPQYFADIFSMTEMLGMKLKDITEKVTMTEKSIPIKRNTSIEFEGSGVKFKVKESTEFTDFGKTKVKAFKTDGYTYGTITPII